MMPNIDQQPVENDETSQIIKVVDPLKFDSSLMRDLQTEHSNDQNKLKKLTAEIGSIEDQQATFQQVLEKLVPHGESAHDRTQVESVNKYYLMYIGKF